MRSLLFLLVVTSIAVAKPVNTTCPMIPDEAITDTDNVVEYNDQEVAFCCKRCVGKWNALDASQKQAKLDAVLATPATPGTPAAPTTPEAPEASSTEVPMDQLDPLGLCPKSGADAGSMGKATRRVINGVDVTFCCPPCIKPYEANYEEYREKIGNQIVLLELPYYPTDRCIVSGKKLGEETDAIDYVLGNRLVRLENRACIEQLNAEPAKYNQRLDYAIKEAERKDYPLETCIVGGGPLNPDKPPVEVVVGNRLMKLCCGGCKAKIRETPYVYVAKINEAWAEAASSKDDKPGS